VVWWKFNQIEKNTVQESIVKIEDMLSGHYRIISGVSDDALELDGYTAHVVRKSENMPELAKMFTVQAWIAPQTYPWNETAIVDWEQDQQKGFTFGVNAYGRIYFYVSVEGECKKLVTQSSIPLWKWTHIATTCQLHIDDQIVMKSENFRYGLRDATERFNKEEKHRQIREERIGVEFPEIFTKQKGKDLIIFIKMKKTNSVKITLTSQ